MDKRTLENMISVAAGRKPADLCMKGCRIVDVFNKCVVEGNVYIKDGYFVGFGKDGFSQAAHTVDAKGLYMAPGFIDSHVHIESSHLSPGEFARLVVPHGTTTVIADPHEIANVCGLDGIDYMLDASEGLPLSVFLQLPSCVPCTPFENAGAILKAEDLAKRFGRERVLGLGELMDYVGVENCDSDVLDKVLEAKKAGKIIDGHSPGIGGTRLDAYACVGIRTDHECATPEDLRERVRRGIYVLLRQGTACHDLVSLCKGVDDRNIEWCLFCTDDRQAHSILTEGHIDNNVRMAIDQGVDPIGAICMATINAANCFHLDDRGAIAPGRVADFVLFDSLEDVRICQVYASGRKVAQDGKAIFTVPNADASKVFGRVNVKDASARRFALPLRSSKVRTLKIIPGSVVTEQGSARVSVKDGLWVRDSQDIVKIAVVERHKGTGNIGIALLEGFGLKGGAIATSVAHDSHNIIVAGDSDEDMSQAVSELVRIGGGMALAKGGKVIASVRHEIAGLMTGLTGEQVAQKVEEITNMAHKELSISHELDPFMTLCFMSLPVIPKLKVTDMGMFDVSEFKFVPLEIDAVEKGMGK